MSTTDTLRLSTAQLDVLDQAGVQYVSRETDGGLQLCVVSWDTPDDFVASGGQDVLRCNDATFSRLRHLGRCSMTTQHGFFILIVLDH